MSSLASAPLAWSLARRRPATSWSVGLAVPASARPSLTLQASVQALPAESFSGAFRLTLAAASPDGSADPAAFLHLLRPPAPGATTRYAAFQKVCEPTDLQRHPPGAPWPDADPPWFRLPTMTADFRSRAELLACQALVVAQLTGTLTSLAAMAPQVAADPLAVGSGARSLAIATTTQPSYTPATMDALRVSYSVAAAVGLDRAIFLCLARTAPAYPTTQYATFQRVCTPDDLAAWPTGAPAPGADPAWFRVAAITLDFEDAATAAAARAALAADAQALLAALAAADAVATPSTLVVTG